jgi:hypothetical protein
MMPTPAIARLDEQAMTVLLGKDAVRSLANRTRGGQSAYKGHRYEHLFGAHRIARLSRELIQRGEDACVEWQSNGFVDDFVVRRDRRASFKGYQLKNSPNVSWTAENSSIASAFAWQYALSAAENYTDVRLRLVCSDAETVAVLRNTVPQPIAGYSRALFFPYTEHPLQLLQEHDWMATDFAYLSRSEAPNRVEIDQVVSLLVGAWFRMAPKALVSEVIAQARDMSPTLLRALRPDADAQNALSQDARAVLDGVTNFSYAIRRGFLHWSALSGSTQGVLSFDCFTAKFEAWQQRLVQAKPRTFEELEGTLV